MTVKIGYSTLCLQNQHFKVLKSYLSKYPQSVCELMNDGPHVLNTERVQALKQVGSSYDLEYTMHLPFAHFNYASGNSSLRRGTQRIILTALNNAAQLQCTHAVIHSGQVDALSAIFYPKLAQNYSFKFLEKVGKTADDLGIQMVIENSFPRSYFIHSIDAMAHFFEEDLSRHFKIALDIGHAFLTLDLDEYPSRFQGNIQYVHLHDNFGKQDDHLPLGQGMIDWHQTIKNLLAKGFNGILITENLSWEANILSLRALGEYLAKLSKRKS